MTPIERTIFWTLIAACVGSLMIELFGFQLTFEIAILYGAIYQIIKHKLWRI